MYIRTHILTFMYSTPLFIKCCNAVSGYLLISKEGRKEPNTHYNKRRGLDFNSIYATQ